MIGFKLAYRNLIGAWRRTLLIVIVLSLAYFLIVFMNGMYQGWDKQARIDMTAWEVGGGQYWHQEFDPYDAFTLTDAHAPVPPELAAEVQSGSITPILISQATIYPEGRIQSILLKGIGLDQKVLSIPADQLKTNEDAIPAIIGTRMAQSARLEVGDYLLIRWRDVNGTFDATEVLITGIFSTTVPAVDNGQVWIPIEDMRNMLQMEGEATMMVVADNDEPAQSIAGWEFQDHSILFAELEAMIQSKSVGGSIFYLIILAMALLAVFDTQVLSIFRRQREIGTYISMGMTRREVIGLFTVEGAMHAFMALVFASIYGVPVLILVAKKGIGMPEGTDEFGMAAAERIMPYYSLALILGSIILVMITTTIVSYMPSRKIAKMNPTEAIRGRIQ